MSPAPSLALVLSDTEGEIYDMGTVKVYGNKNPSIEELREALNQLRLLIFAIKDEEIDEITETEMGKEEE